MKKRKSWQTGLLVLLFFLFLIIISGGIYRIFYFRSLSLQKENGLTDELDEILLSLPKGSASVGRYNEGEVGFVDFFTTIKSVDKNNKRVKVFKGDSGRDIWIDLSSDKLNIVLLKKECNDLSSLCHESGNNYLTKGTFDDIEIGKDVRFYITGGVKDENLFAELIMVKEL